jgi:cytochrome c5
MKLMNANKNVVAIPEDQTQAAAGAIGDGLQEGSTVKKYRRLKSLVRAVAIAGIAAAMVGGLTSVLRADDTKAADTKTADTNVVAAAAKPVEPETKAKKLTGAELYEIHCNRCHSERYPTEFTSAQWKTIMMHMRVRANLPAAQAREILKFLQEDSGS